MWEQLGDTLANHFSTAGVACKRHVELAEFTTFRLGGRCPLLVECRTPTDVRLVVHLLVQHQVPYVFIGGGSNLLIADAGIDEVVVRYVAEAPHIILNDHDQITVSGGTLLDDLALFCVEHGFAEMVKTSGIPGTVGGAIIGNAGAFGWQIADALTGVQLLDRQGNERTATPQQLGFAYRDSLLKQTREIVLEATLALPAGDADALQAERQDILALRTSKHPDLAQDCCAGSFFRNVEPTSKAARRQAAGWFLEQAGAKELRVGGAAVYPKHANIIVKGDASCRAQDVLDLSRQMGEAVRTRFGFELVREVQLLGNFSE